MRWPKSKTFHLASAACSPDHHNSSCRTWDTGRCGPEHLGLTLGDQGLGWPLHPISVPPPSPHTLRALATWMEDIRQRPGLGPASGLPQYKLVSWSEPAMVP